MEGGLGAGVPAGLRGLRLTWPTQLSWKAATGHPALPGLQELRGAGKCSLKAGWVVVTAATRLPGHLGSVLILNRLGRGLETGEEAPMQDMEESSDLGGQWGAWGPVVLAVLHLPPALSPPSSALPSARNEAGLSLAHQWAPCQLASG